MVRFGASNVPYLTISQIRLGYSQVDLGHDHPKSKFRFGIYQVGFGTWSSLDYNSSIISNFTVYVRGYSKELYQVAKRIFSIAVTTAYFGKTISTMGCIQ